MRVVIADTDRLGDCPTWDDSIQRLFWIDISGRRMSSCAADGSALERRSFEEIPGSFALRRDGGMLVGFRRRLALFDAAGVQRATIIPGAADMSRERFNDGACDPKGRFWIGTMDRYLKDPIGALYRIDADLSAHRMDVGLGISNGIAWSPRFDRLYHCDSRFPQIYEHDFDLEAGTIANRRVFAKFSDGMGVPDGCAVDLEGLLWVAAPGTGQIFGFDPRGRLAKQIATPVMWPSSVTFGGTGSRTMFITSLQPSEALSSPDQPRQLMDGAVFATEVDVPGLQRVRFGG